MSQFKYVPLEKKYFERVNEVVSQAFSKFDPMISAVELDVEETRVFVNKLLERSLEQKTTIVCVDDATDEVAGAIISEDLTTEEFPMSILNKNKWEPVLEVVDSLDHFYMEKLEAQPKYRDILHMFMMGVDKRFKGNKIGETLTVKALENAQELGYKTAIAELTGPISQHIYQTKLGFEELKELTMTITLIMEIRYSQ